MPPSIVCKLVSPQAGADAPTREELAGFEIPSSAVIDFGLGIHSCTMLYSYM